MSASRQTRPIRWFRLGGTLGAENKHWFRDKFGNGRFRLFFKFDTRSKVIIYAWVNDENSLRAYSAKTDTYAVFAKMLRKDNPPATWAELLAASRIQSASKSSLIERLTRSLPHTQPCSRYWITRLKLPAAGRLVANRHQAERVAAGFGSRLVKSELRAQLGTPRSASSPHACPSSSTAARRRRRCSAL